MLPGKKKSKRDQQQLTGALGLQIETVREEKIVNANVTTTTTDKNPSGY